MSDSRSIAVRRSDSSTGTHRLLVTICTVLATLMQSLDSTIANVALPYMQGTMSASQDEINWVLTSYIVAAAIMTTPTGFLAARFGRTRLFVTAVVGFTVASALCGLADSLGEIVVFRIVQGMFGAALVPLSQSVMYELYPPEQRAKAMGLWTMGVMMGPICGPILGGWLTENYTWRWVFYINVPFGIVTALGLLILLQETASSQATKLDWLGFSTLSLAIGAFQMMLDRGRRSTGSVRAKSCWKPASPASRSICSWSSSSLRRTHSSRQACSRIGIFPLAGCSTRSWA